jgi:hypothetical protein
MALCSVPLISLAAGIFAISRRELLAIDLANARSIETDHAAVAARRAAQTQ